MADFMCVRGAAKGLTWRCSEKCPTANSAALRTCGDSSFRPRYTHCTNTSTYLHAQFTNSRTRGKKQIKQLAVDDPKGSRTVFHRSLHLVNVRSDPPENWSKETRGNTAISCDSLGADMVGAALAADANGSESSTAHVGVLVLQTRLHVPHLQWSPATSASICFLLAAGRRPNAYRTVSCIRRTFLAQN